MFSHLTLLDLIKFLNIFKVGGFPVFLAYVSEWGDFEDVQHRGEILYSESSCSRNWY